MLHHMKPLWRTAIAIGVTYVAGIIGFLFINSQASDWYASIQKPSLAPSLWLTFVAFVILYGLMGIACAIIWIRDEHNNYSHGWIRFYFVQLLLSTGWLIFFLGMHAITLALLDVLILFFIVAILAVVGWEIDNRVGYLMVPCALWLLFIA